MQIILGPKFLSEPEFFQTHIFFQTKNLSCFQMSFNENYIWRDKTELLKLRLSKLPGTKVLFNLEFDTEDRVLLSVVNIYSF